MCMYVWVQCVCVWVSGPLYSYIYIYIYRRSLSCALGIGIPICVCSHAMAAAPRSSLSLQQTRAVDPSSRSPTPVREGPPEPAWACCACARPSVLYWNPVIYPAAKLWNSVDRLALSARDFFCHFFTSHIAGGGELLLLFFFSFFLFFARRSRRNFDSARLRIVLRGEEDCEGEIWSGRIL